MIFEQVYEFPNGDLLSAWRECLSRIDCPSHYTAPEYFLEPFWTGCKRCAILARENGSVTGVLTGFHEGDQFTSGLESRPQICIDPTQDRAAVLEALLRGLLEESADAALVTVYTWADLELPSFSQRGFSSRRLEGNVVLDLTSGADALFKHFTKDRRRNIRFAGKQGVEVSEVTTEEDVVQAFQIYEAWWQNQRRRRYGNPPVLEVFQKAARLTSNRLILLARVSGRPIAVNVFRFLPGGLFESAANSSLREFLHLKPNDLLQWRGIQWACLHGMCKHSLGGAHEFLRRFGGEVVPVVRYRLDRTLLHRYDLREVTSDYGRQVLRMIPARVQQRARQTWGK